VHCADTQGPCTARTHSPHIARTHSPHITCTRIASALHKHTDAPSFTHGTCVGFARTIYIRCVYGIIGRKITKYSYTVHISVLANPTLVASFSALLYVLATDLATLSTRRMIKHSKHVNFCLLLCPLECAGHRSCRPLNTRRMIQHSIYVNFCLLLCPLVCAGHRSCRPPHAAHDSTLKLRELLPSSLPSRMCWPQILPPSQHATHDSTLKIRELLPPSLPSRMCWPQILPPSQHATHDTTLKLRELLPLSLPSCMCWPQILPPSTHDA